LFWILDKHTQSSSLSEKKALALVDHHSLDLILNNQRLITRVYPAAYRQDSSNVEAVSFWNTGVQMGSTFPQLSFPFYMFIDFVVALNFQTGDVSMSLNHGRFSDNNQCGYILKPAVLRESKVLSNDNLKDQFSIWLDHTTFSPSSCFSAYLLAGRRPLKLELCVN
jgi:hypothetical protein